MSYNSIQERRVESEGHEGGGDLGVRQLVMSDLIVQELEILAAFSANFGIYR